MADRKIPVEIAPVVNTGEAAGIVPGAAPQPLAPFAERSGWTEGDASRTQPAMQPVAPEEEERKPGSLPPDRTRR